MSHCLLPIQGTAVATVQFIHLSQTYSVAATPVVHVSLLEPGPEQSPQSVRFIDLPQATSVQQVEQSSSYIYRRSSMLILLQSGVPTAPRCCSAYCLNHCQGSSCLAGKVQFIDLSPTASVVTAPTPVAVTTAAVSTTDKASTISAAGTALYPNRLPVLLLVRYQRRDSSGSSLYRSAATAPVSLTVLPRSPLLILLQHLLTVADFQLQCLLSSTTVTVPAVFHYCPSICCNASSRYQGHGSSLFVLVQGGSCSSAAAVRTYVAEPTVATKVEAPAFSFCS
jgi:hypothetical protein